MWKLRRELGRFGVGEEDFRTANFQFRKQRDPEKRYNESVEGFSANHMLSVTVRDTEMAGRVMDALVAAGADGLQVSSGYGYGYSQDVRPQSIKRARHAAIKDAREKA